MALPLQKKFSCVKFSIILKHWIFCHFVCLRLLIKIFFTDHIKRSSFWPSADVKPMSIDWSMQCPGSAWLLSLCIYYNTVRFPSKQSRQWTYVYTKTAAIQYNNHAYWLTVDLTDWLNEERLECRPALCLQWGLLYARKPSSWTNFSALPALYTSQRDKEREREREGERKRESEKEGEGKRDRDREKERWRVLWHLFLLSSLIRFSRPTRGARKLTGDNLKLVWAEFSTLS